MELMLEPCFIYHSYYHMHDHLHRLETRRRSRNPLTLSLDDSALVRSSTAAVNGVKPVITLTRNGNQTAMGNGHDFYNAHTHNGTSGLDTLPPIHINGKRKYFNTISWRHRDYIPVCGNCLQSLCFHLWCMVWHRCSASESLHVLLHNWDVLPTSK